MGEMIFLLLSLDVSPDVMDGLAEVMLEALLPPGSWAVALTCPDLKDLKDSVNSFPWDV